MLTCVTCGEEIETLKGAAHEIVGFEQARDQGGTNHVLFRQRTGNVMCPACVLAKKFHVPAGQLTLT